MASSTNSPAEPEAAAGVGAPAFDIPLYHTQPPKPRDDLVTDTSKLQDATVAKCLPFLLGIDDPSRNPFDFNEFGVPRLDRIDHVDFLEDGLGDFPPGFVAADASRPWMVYWALNGLNILGRDVSGYRKDVIKTFTAAQSPSGGFGGGHGHLPHLACSYAAILSISLVGGPEVYSMIDRQSMWRWLGRLKQPSGGFQICEGGEIDTRGAYSAMVLITLLNLPLTLPLDSPARAAGHTTFISGLAEWIASCQTYQGGIGGSPGNEAHGAYTFLGIACLCLLGPPHITLSKYLDLDRLITWLSMSQNAPEGGLAGRSNKLVDGCYSHWCGGCFPLVQTAIQGPQRAEQAQEPKVPQEPQGSKGSSSKGFTRDLYNREGLIRYTLNCCQQKFGGLRDKPGKRADSYHTCYTLSALSQTQYRTYWSQPPATSASSSSTSGSSSTSSYSSHPAFGYQSIAIETEGGERRVVYDESDQVNAIHPIFVIGYEAVEGIRGWAAQFSSSEEGETWQ